MPQQLKKSRPLYTQETDYLVPRLLENRLVDQWEIETIQREVAGLNLGVVGTLFLLGRITSMDIATFQAEHFGLRAIDLNEIGTIDPRIISLVSGDIARKYRVIPVDEYGSTIVVATAHPGDLNTLDALLHMLHKGLDIKVAAPEAITMALKRYYPDTVVRIPLKGKPQRVVKT